MPYLPFLVLAEHALSILFLLSLPSQSEAHLIEQVRSKGGSR